MLKNFFQKEYQTTREITLCCNVFPGFFETLFKADKKKYHLLSIQLFIYMQKCEVRKLLQICHFLSVYFPEQFQIIGGSLLTHDQSFNCAKHINIYKQYPRIHVSLWYALNKAEKYIGFSSIWDDAAIYKSNQAFLHFISCQTLKHRLPQFNPPYQP